MQNNNKNIRKLLNSKKDSLPAAEVRNNVANFRNKKFAPSIKKSNSRIHNANANVSTINNCNSSSSSSNTNNNTNTNNTAKTTVHKSSTKQNAAAAAAATKTLPDAVTTTAMTVVPQNSGCKMPTESVGAASSKPKTTKAIATTIITATSATTTNSIETFEQGKGNNIKTKTNLAEKPIVTLSSPHQQHKNASSSSSNHTKKPRNHGTNGNGTVSISNGEVEKPTATTVTHLKAKKQSETEGAISSTAIAIATVATTTAAAATATSSSSAATSTSTPTTQTQTQTQSKTKVTAIITNGNANGINGSNGNSSGDSTCSNGGNNNSNNCNENNNKKFQIPSDILDDLASRFIINVPDMELNNLIRICFQIELAHWFYLDFFCSSTDEDVKTLQPVGMRYFAAQLFQHIPFLSHHLPAIDSVLQDWKSYKLAVPTYGAILISQDLQYCLLVQSYFAKSSWGFPKGKVNETEDPEHCATREVFEETGYDITGLIVPKDYIEAVINDQYTRLYIICNVSLGTVFEPRTRNEIRSCVWFPIDSLPNNKNDAISKAKLGQNANSFFMILPFVKRLKKWVNEKRLKTTTTGPNINDSNNAPAAAAVTDLVSVSNGTAAASLPNNDSKSTNDRRKYSINGVLNCSNGIVVANGVVDGIAAGVANVGTGGVGGFGSILKSPSLGYVGELQFNNNINRSNVSINTNGTSKKNRQQTQQQQQQQIVITNSNSGCKIETTTTTTTTTEIESNAVAESAVANMRSKRQRHKSMGDLDNTNVLNANNNSNNNNNTNKNNNSNNHKRNIMQKTNTPITGTVVELSASSTTSTSTTKLSAHDNHHNTDNAAQNTGSSSRRQLFHSQSQNDGVISFMGGSSKRDQNPQQPRFMMEHVQIVQQQKKQHENAEFLKFLTEALNINDQETNKAKRQRAKSQSDKASNQQQQQQLQLHAINNCFFNNNANNNMNGTPTTNKSSSSPLCSNMKGQNSLVKAKSTILGTTKTTTTAAATTHCNGGIEINEIPGIINLIDNGSSKIDIHNDDDIFIKKWKVNGVISVYGDQQRQRRYTTEMAPMATSAPSIITGNDLIAWSAGRAQQQLMKTPKTKTNINKATNAATSEMAATTTTTTTSSSSSSSVTTKTTTTPTPITKSTTIKGDLINKPKMTKTVVEASAIETKLIQQKQHQQQQQQQQQKQIFPFMLNVQQHEQQQKENLKQNQQKLKQQQKPRPLSMLGQQQNQQEKQLAQHQQHPLQHSSSSPGLATWKNFSFTKNLISNVFL